MMKCLCLVLLLVGPAFPQRGAETPSRGQPSSGKPQDETYAYDEYIYEDVVCEEPYGFYPDPYQCDRYYECRNNTVIDKLCRDGLSFHHFLKTCHLTAEVDCEGRETWQPPQPSPHCPRQNGYYPNEDPSICDKFWQCSDGKANEFSCPPGLVFEINKTSCNWPGAVKRVGCKNALNFTCPKQTVHEQQTNLHPRYPDPDDCQYFFVCLNGNDPRRHGCPFGQVFDIETSACNHAFNVSDCIDRYLGDPRYDAYVKEFTKPVAKTKAPANIRRRRPLRRKPITQAPVIKLVHPLETAEPQDVQPARRPLPRPAQDRPRTRPRPVPETPATVDDIVSGDYFNEQPLLLEEPINRPQSAQQYIPDEQPTRIRNRPGSRLGLLRRRFNGGRQPVEETAADVV